ncbi:MAG TPA: peptidylprolyl isomerase [Polyangiaceae bacterium]
MSAASKLCRPGLLAQSAARALVALWVLGGLPGCRGQNSQQQAPSAPDASARSEAAQLARLLQSEQRRDTAGVSEEDLGAPSSARREAAVRTLARIQDERSFEPLAKALADEAPAVVAWAAFGVGKLCQGHEPEAVRRLVLGAARLNAAPPSAPQDAALGAVSLALGRCASEEAERSLRSWLRLRAELSQAAALGLGQVARARQRLDDATVAQLLDAAEQQPSALYLFPLESLPALGSAARQRLTEVAKTALGRTPTRAFAIRALAKAGPEGARLLRDVLLDDGWNDAERADAARSLAAMGGTAQAELAAALGARAGQLLDQQAFLTSQLGVVLTLLEGLEPKRAEPGLLAELAQLPLTGEPPVVRRKVKLRCRAAALLAGRSSASASLLGCDPSPPAERREGSLALLRVLGRGPLDKERSPRFLELAGSSDRVVREAAIELLMAHDEVPGVSAVLASALGAAEVGVTATAAKVLARYPARAQLAPPAEGAQAASAPLDPRVVQALSKRLAEVGVSQNIELSALLLDAAVALELLGAKPALERACASSNPTLRQHAERGLIALGDAKRRCPSVADQSTLGALPPAVVRLELDTDLGPLSLVLAGDKQPFAVGRVLELARAGFYDGMGLQRVVPGFVVQLGDPDGDGFGGPDQPPLRCQLGPEPFEVGSVGVALAGRDTGGSQLFIALRRAPHLDGEYSLIGQAGPGWERLSPGDRILKMRVVEGVY